MYKISALALSLSCHKLDINIVTLACPCPLQIYIINEPLNPFIQNPFIFYPSFIMTVKKTFNPPSLCRFIIPSHLSLILLVSLSNLIVYVSDKRLYTLGNMFPQLKFLDMRVKLHTLAFLVFLLRLFYIQLFSYIVLVLIRQINKSISKTFLVYI